MGRLFHGRLGNFLTFFFNWTLPSNKKNKIHKWFWFFLWLITWHKLSIVWFYYIFNIIERLIRLLIQPFTLSSINILTWCQTLEILSIEKLTSSAKMSIITEVCNGTWISSRLVTATQLYLRGLHTISLIQGRHIIYSLNNHTYTINRC